METSNSNRNEKIPWFDFCNLSSPKTKIRNVLVHERNFSDSNISTMSKNRFQLIESYLLFNDSTAAGTNKDSLYKICTILDTVINNFRTNYMPDREISLDEGMLGWRSRLRSRVYNSGKITKYGILLLLLLLRAHRLMHRLHRSLRLTVQPQYVTQHSLNNPAPRMKRQRSPIEAVLMSFGSTVGLPKTL
jgi:hypothetical protein